MIMRAFVIKANIEKKIGSNTIQSSPVQMCYVVVMFFVFVVVIVFLPYIDNNTSEYYIDIDV